MSFTAEHARKVLKQQALAMSTLTGYARYIDIPGVPDETDVDDRIHAVVETPLARHHVLVLNTLQLLVQGLLMYDPQALDSPLDYASLLGEDATPAPGRGGGGVALLKPSDPSLTKIPAKPYPSKVHSGSQNGLPMPPSLPSTLKSAEKQGDISAEFPEKAVRAIRTTVRAVLSGKLDPVDAMAIMAAELPEMVACKRVMLMLPPGSAKSTYASVVFPTWVMGKVKAFETILTGWGDPICRRHGKRARKICASPQFNVLFNTGLDASTKAAEDWALQNGSSYKSSGIQSGVAGFRTHGLVWDDLTKNRKEADSETIRNDVHNAYIDDARSRKTPTAWEVGIGTRWHEDEIMGRILPEGYSGESGFIRCRDGNVWFVICMAAECEQPNDPLGREVGEMLWPEWFTEEYWDEKRLVPRSWGSLYQQRPAPEEGIMFKRDRFKRYDTLPSGYNLISYDPGVSAEGDPTSILLWRVDEFARLYLIDRFYMRCAMDGWIPKLIEWVRLHKPMEVISEAGLIRKAAEPWVARAKIHEKVFFTEEWVNRTANKAAMAQGALAMVNSGQIYLPKNSDGDAVLEACAKFPASKDDHDVDALVNLCLRLETIWAANTPTPTTVDEPTIIGSDKISVKSLMPPRFSKKRSRWDLRAR